MPDKSQQIRQAVLAALPARSSDVSGVIGRRFGISRQAVSRHVRRLIEHGEVTASGNTRARRLDLASHELGQFRYPLPQLDDDEVWRNDVQPLLADLPQNARDIWHYAVTEMVNNANDHSAGAILSLRVGRDALSTAITLYDDGIGIFNKIMRALNLAAPEHAVLELAKGKFTTDPDNHSGEGIFFTSRALDRFTIVASGLHASHVEGAPEDWVIGQGDHDEAGTLIVLRLANDTTRGLDDVFDAYADPDDDYVFTKTIVPVDLVRYGDERVVSRSQAKRLLRRLERFNTVILDFEGIHRIGQAFSDEVFRVFTNAHPHVRLEYRNANAQVEKMIRRAQASGDG